MSPLCPLELFQCMPYTFALTGANIIYMLRNILMEEVHEN